MSNPQFAANINNAFNRVPYIHFLRFLRPGPSLTVSSSVIREEAILGPWKILATKLLPSQSNPNSQYSLTRFRSVATSLGGRRSRRRYPIKIAYRYKDASGATPSADDPSLEITHP